ncbi:MAG: BamA/TamA family outer membrane protein [Chitinophagaceae bacterium]
MTFQKNSCLYKLLPIAVTFLLGALHAYTQLPISSHRIIIIGDAGGLINGKSIVADAAANHISKDNTNTTVIFTGDNLYSKGLPDEEDADYSYGTDVLKKQLLAFKDHQAKVYMIPGNHDWQEGGPRGWEYVKRQASWAGKINPDKIFFLPQDGCPGPEEVVINDSIVLIIMDSQWWLHPYAKPDVNSDCICKTEDEILSKLHDIAYRNKNKKILFASHHPFRSYGIHGGYQTFRQHFFPFTDMSRNAYIPLPVLGSIYPIVRGQFGNIQDIRHPRYSHMTGAVEKRLAVAKQVTYVSGHDHNLQLIRANGRNYIVSGSGIKTSRVRKGKNALYASDHLGFAEIEYLNNGTERISFYTVANGVTNLAYSYDLPPVKETVDTPMLAEATMITADSITVAIAPAYDKPGGFHRFLFGDNYRKLWATPVRMKVFNLKKEKTGLTILQKGGGQQTKSLRLQDTNGKEWVLRSVQKDPEKALPENLRKTIALKILQDQISAAHPYAPLSVPALASALGIAHARPEIVYVPDDTALGIYRNDFAGTVCLFEEREPDEAGNTLSTSKVLDKLEEDNDNRVDQKAVLKARLLDLFIGDWDRHEDQWRWIKREGDKGNIYSPVPRDRDQVFFINTGLIPRMASRKWIQPKFQGFSQNIRDVNGFMFNARYFDRLFLHQLSEADWKEVIKAFLGDLSDDLIKRSVLKLPDTIYALSGSEITRILLERRKIIEKEALKYYRFLSKTVDIPGSDKKEVFEINDADGQVNISIFKASKEEAKGRLLFQRKFEPGITREIRLYGRGEEDVFTVKGHRSPIRIRMIGGGSNDSFYVDGSASGRRHRLIYDRSDKQDIFPDRSLAKLIVSTDKSVNEYNARNFRYDKLMPKFTAGLNLDDGLVLGLGFQYTKHGFRKDPYAAKHDLMVGHALATRASFIHYSGDFIKLLGSNDVNIVINARAPDNTNNFFGAGNETTFLKQGKTPIQFYRTRYNLTDTRIKLQRSLTSYLKISGGIMAQFFSMDSADNRGRFINIYKTETGEQDLFSKRTFAGIVTGVTIDTRNNLMMPGRGIYWNTTITGMHQLNKKNSFGQLLSEMSVFTSFAVYPGLIIANRLGAGLSIGHPQFYQLFVLGGTRNLRGFRNERFSGKSMAYHNLEIRVKLFDFNSFLFPASVGLTGFNDVGRVWMTDRPSKVWHHGYGGGLYIVPAELILINALAGFSKEGVLPHISLGFRF